MRHKNVADAFELLLGEVAAALAAIREEGAQAFRRGDNRTVRALALQADAVQEFLDDLRAKHREWKRLVSGSARPGKARQERKRVPQGPRTPPGLLTPHAAFCRPILEALVQLSGSADTPAVLEKVGEIMVSVLTSADREPVKSGEPRWRNRAAWVRLYLVREGLLSASSKRGVWEITTAGRRWLENNEEVPHSIPGWRKLQQQRPAS